MNRKRSYFWVPLKCTCFVFFHLIKAFLGVSLSKDPIKWVEDRRQALMFRFLKIPRVQLEIVGAGKIYPNSSYLFMSNHESLWDIPLVQAAIPNMLRMVSKEALFKIPIFGGLMKKTGCMPVDRSNPTKAIRQLENVKKQLTNGVSMWMAPEGTRKYGKEIGPFKKGGFHVAIDAGIPIVPVLIEGAYDLTPRGKFYVNLDVPVKVSFGEPIETSGYSKTDVNRLAEKVREAMVNLGRRKGPRMTSSD